MGALPAGWLLAAVELLVLLGAVGLVVHLFRRDGEASGAADWCDSAVELAVEVRDAARIVEPPADPDAVSRRLLPLAARIRGHVRSAPASVDETAYRELFDLGVACQHLALERRRADAMVEGPFLEDRLESLRDRAASVEAQLEASR